MVSRAANVLHLWLAVPVRRCLVKVGNDADSANVRGDELRIETRFLLTFAHDGIEHVFAGGDAARDRVVVHAGPCRFGRRAFRDPDPSIG